MDREVLVTVSGLLFMADEEAERQDIEVIAPGQYYWKNGKHYITYDEMAENFTGDGEHPQERADRDGADLHQGKRKRVSLVDAVRQSGPGDPRQRVGSDGRKRRNPRECGVCLGNQL